MSIERDPLREARSVFAKTERARTGEGTLHKMPSIGAAAQPRHPEYESRRLDPQQEKLVRHMESLDFDTLYTTGPGGYGKSEGITQGICKIKTMVRTIVNAGETTTRPLAIAITAMTGRAADVLGTIEGIQTTTLHSFLGIGRESLRLHDEAHILESFAMRKPVAPLLTDILIIDEASMFTEQQSDVLNRVLQKYRKNYKERFGGMKLILVGDPMQLPPVPPSEGPGSDREVRLPADSILRRVDDRIGTKRVTLNHPHRCGDRDFQVMLRNLVAKDRATREIGMASFLKHYQPGLDTIANASAWALKEGAIILAHTKKIVRQLNEYIRDVLPGDLHEFSDPENLYTIADVLELPVKDGRDPVKEEKEEKDELVKKRMRYFTERYIREGQLVQIRANLDSLNGIQVVCGDLCVFKGTTPTGDAIMVRQKDNQEIIIGKYESASEHWPTLTWRGYPFIMSNAATVHLVQGQTIHGKVLFWSDIKGDIYGNIPFYLNVAASRVTKPENFVITHIPENHIRSLASTQVQETLEQIWDLPFMSDYPTA
jgi:hypothetical protein